MWNFKSCGTLFFFHKKWKKEIQKEKEFKLGFEEDNKRGGILLKKTKKHYYGQTGGLALCQSEPAHHEGWMESGQETIICWVSSFLIEHSG
jgi:hypothetical protein